MVRDFSNKRSYRFVFNGGAGHAQVKLAIFFNASINQSLDRTLILKQKECITFKGKQKGINVVVPSMFYINQLL